MANGVRRPEVAELLASIRERVFQPQSVVDVSAVQTAGMFDSLPEDVAASVDLELAPDRDGWSVDAERRWTVETGFGVHVTIPAGYDLERALAQLDRIRAELVANPGLLSNDWSEPIKRRPALRVVKAQK